MTAVAPLPALDAVALRDATYVVVRPILPSDVVALRRMHSRLSPDTIYGRFMVACPKPPSAATLRYLADVDHDARDALVAMHGGEIVGVARYHTVDEGEAEIAVVVEDAWQRRGLGRVLTLRLARLAAERGIRALSGSMLADNRAATALLAALFPSVERRISHGEVEFRIPLADAVLA